MRALLRARTEAERQRWRQAGYIAAVVINAVLLVIAHTLLRWPIPVITPAWADVLWAIIVLSDKCGVDLARAFVTTMDDLARTLAGGPPDS